MTPKVSVIIPCYNYDKYIEQCILSVIVQRRNFNIEILIGDDNSTDNSLKIIQRIKNSYSTPDMDIRIIHHDTNVGEIDNTKSLLENSNGEYIAYLDADDYWIYPDKLQRQIDYLDSNLDCSLCITGHLQLEDNNWIPDASSASWLCPKDIDNLNSESLTMGNIVGSSSSRVFRNYKDLFKDYFYEFPYSDWVINFELSLRGKIAYLNFPSYVYHYHKNSLSTNDKDFEIAEFLYNKRTKILKDILETL